MWRFRLLRSKPARAEETEPTSRALVTGFFSTVGDLESLRVVKERLAGSGFAFDVAPYSEEIRASLAGAKSLSKIEPRNYSHVVIVCGPCLKEKLEKYEITKKRFGHCTWVGINLTMISPLSEWNPFDVLLERDSDCSTRPDLAFGTPAVPGPVVARCLVHKQGEYGDRQQHAAALDAIRTAIGRHRLAAVDVDTKFPGSRNLSGLSSSDEVISIFKRCDFVMTNRLHGMVFALKAGIPALAVDAVKGGGKITAQAECIGWPICMEAAKITTDRMDDAVHWCMSPEARARAKECAENARAAIDRLEWPAPLISGENIS